MAAIANVEMAEVWDGEEADEWIANADRYDATDRWINERFEAETVIEARDRVLDVAISLFGTMFFADPVAAFANIRRSLRPGGRIAFLSWQAFEHNEWLMTLFEALAAGRDLPTPAAGEQGPFGLADAEAVSTLLREAGFVDGHLTSISAPMWLGASAEDAWEFVAEMGLVRGLTDNLDDATRDQAMAELRRRIDARETADGVTLGTDDGTLSPKLPKASTS